MGLLLLFESTSILQTYSLMQIFQESKYLLSRQQMPLLKEKRKEKKTSKFSNQTLQTSLPSYPITLISSCDTNRVEVKPYVLYIFSQSLSCVFLRQKQQIRRSCIWRKISMFLKVHLDLIYYRMNGGSRIQQTFQTGMSIMTQNSLHMKRLKRQKQYLEHSSSQQELFVQMVKANPTKQTSRINQLRRNLANPQSERQIINVVSQTDTKKTGRSPRSRGISIVSKSREKKQQKKEVEHSAYISPPFFVCCEEASKEEILRIDQSSQKPQTKKIEQSESLNHKEQTEKIEHHASPIEPPPRKKQEQKQECQVCCQGYNLKEMKVFGGCGHKYCAICLHRHIENTINSFNIVKCLNENCAQMLDVSSPHIQSLEAPIRQRYQKIRTTLNNLKDQEKRVCPSEQCSGFLRLSDEMALCNVCKVQFCKQCLYPMHSGNCDQNGALYMMDELLFKQCSRCKMFIQRNQGCPHMTCKCGYQFCYPCGQKWSQGHTCKSPAYRFFKNGILAISFAFLIVLVHVLTFQYAYPIFMCIIVPIMATIFFFFYSLGLGVKEMVKQEKCLAIFLLNIFLLFRYAAPIFLDKTRHFFKFTYCSSQFLKLNCLFPISYVLYHEMKERMT